MGGKTRVLVKWDLFGAQSVFARAGGPKRVWKQPGDARQRGPRPRGGGRGAVPPALNRKQPGSATPAQQGEAQSGARLLGFEQSPALGPGLRSGKIIFTFVFAVFPS